MKLLIIPLITVFFSYHSFAQILHPANWSVFLEPTTPEVEGKADLVFNAVIDEGWYLYANDFDPDLGPMLTTFSFAEHSSFELVGATKSIESQKKYDDIWDGDYTYFIGKGQFRQTILVKEKHLVLAGNYDYQVCTDVDGRCIPFSEEFSVKVEAKSSISKVGDEIESKINIKESETENQKEWGKGENTRQGENQEVIIESQEPNTIRQGKPTFKTQLSERDSKDPYSLIAFVLVAFLAGLVALLTPCVFPMIPLTVSYFSDRSKKGHAFIYGVSIIFIYTVFGTLMAWINGPEFANWLSTHWLPNILFFIVFIFFAFAFLGAYEIVLPSSLINKVDQKAEKRGLAGVFFMAFTLVLVSFSCTGPIVGGILVESAGGQVIKPILGMLAFSIAFAAPFTLFAIFPSWLNHLPKSGGWLNSVKVVLGFLELAFAFKFLSIADQVYHWGILDREVYLSIWIGIFSMLGFYFLGKIRLPQDSPMKNIPVPRLLLSIITFTFVIYMIPGLWGAPLKALSGYLPPMTTQNFNLNRPSGTGTNGQKICEDPKFSDILSLPHGLKGYFDYEQALACAKEQGKPLFIDFTGHGCVNCREMEARVWSDPAVLKILKEKYILLALYVDEKTKLPEQDWYTSTYDQKVKKTLGKQNADLQIMLFKNNAQPFYVLLDNDGELLIEPKAYDLSISNFVYFLEAGVKEYELNSNAKSQ